MKRSDCIGHFLHVCKKIFAFYLHSFELVSCSLLRPEEETCDEQTYEDIMDVMKDSVTFNQYVSASFVHP